MDDSSYMLVFFDNFNHGTKPEVQLDSVRFSQPVKIGFIRIIPFGVAIESEIDNEPRYGVTNPQNFHVTFYVHKNTDIATFDKIGEMDFDEKTGSTSIRFPSMPLASILAISGHYNVLSIAVFGIISPHALTNVNPNQQINLNSLNKPSALVPINNQNLPIYGNVLPMYGGFRGSNTNSSNNTNNNSVANVLSNVPVSNPLVLNASISNNPSAVLMSLALAANQHNTTNNNNSNNNSNSVNNNNANMNTSQQNIQPQSFLSNIQPDHKMVDNSISISGLYEDGEIQEIDYEDVSSNEDLLFGLDDDLINVISTSGSSNVMDTSTAGSVLDHPHDVALHSVINGSTATSVKKISTGFPDLDRRLITDRWRFLPKRCVLQGQLLVDLKVIPNSHKTLYEVELDRLCKEEQQARTRNSSLSNSLKSQQDNIPDSANILIDLVTRFSDETKFNSDWIEHLENLPKSMAKGLAYLTYTDKATAENVIDCMINWLKVGLSCDCALKQQHNLYILRHLRTGISLAGYLTSLNSSIAYRCLSDLPNNEAFNVQHQLLDLLDGSNSMMLTATPIKLQIIRALDLSTRLDLGLDTFIRVVRVTSVAHVGVTNKLLTPYQRLVYFVMKKNTARVTIACGRLLNKLHGYEVLINFRDNIQKLRNILSESSESIRIKSECSLLLMEIIRYFIHASQMIANPRKSMPCGMIFDESHHKPHNPYHNLLHMMYSTSMLDNIDWILSHCPNSTSTSSHIQHNNQQLVNRSLRLLWEMCQRHDSLVYLMSNPNGTTDRLLRRLFNLSCDNSNTTVSTGSTGFHFIHPTPGRPQTHHSTRNESSNTSSSQTNSTNQQLMNYRGWIDIGVELAFKLEAMRFLDELLHWCIDHGGLAGLAANTGQLLEDSQLASILLGFAKLSGERKGAVWIAQVISMDDNIAALIPLFEALEKKTQQDSENTSSGTTKSHQQAHQHSSSGGGDKTRVPLPHSICLHYLPNLLSSILRHADNASYLNKYGCRLAALGKNNDSLQLALANNTSTNPSTNNSASSSATAAAAASLVANSSPFSEARDWLQPLTDLPTSSPLEVECLPHLIEHLKVSCSEVDTANIPPALITVLRLLKLHLVQPSSTGVSAFPLLYECVAMNATSESSATSQSEDIHSNGNSHVKLILENYDDPYSIPQGFQQQIIRYKYAIGEFYQHDGLTILNKLIQQLSDQHQLSWQCGIEHIDNRYPQLLCVAEPACAIICAVTQLLIQSRADQFKDVTGLGALFSCFTVFCSGLTLYQFVSSIRFRVQLESIKKSIIYTVLAYTQSQLPKDEEDNEKSRASAIDKSLWTCMLRELISYTLTAPYAFCGGLTLFIELLPLPLPLSSDTALTEAQLAGIQRSRALWSAHLLSCREELRQFIHTIGCSTNFNLNYLWTKLLTQIADLDPATSVMLARMILDSLFEVWERAKKEMEVHNDLVAKQNNTSEFVGDSSGQSSTNKSNSSNALQQLHHNSLLRSDSIIALDDTILHCPDSLELTRTLAQLKMMLTIPTCKHSFLKMIGQKPHRLSGQSSDHQYDNINYEQTFLKIVEDILNANKEDHCATQENVILCLEMLLDGRITVISNEEEPTGVDDVIFDTNIKSQALGNPNPTLIGSLTATTLSGNSMVNQNEVLHYLSNQELINALPNRDQCLQITRALIRHCTNTEQDMSTIISALKTLVVLIGSDYGFRILVEVLQSETDSVFLILLKRVNESFSADNPNCQVVLLKTLSLLQALVLRQESQVINNSLVTGIKLPPRTLNLSDDYIKRCLLLWNSNNDNSSHPVSELYDLLKIVSEEEGSLQNLRDGMESLIELLSNSDIIVGNVDGQEGTLAVMPVCSSLKEIYQMRGIWQRCWNHKYTQAQYTKWLQSSRFNDKDLPDLSRCDLENLAYVCCSGFNLHEELARGRQQDDEAIRHKKRRKGHDAIIHTGRSAKKFVAPMRGRGFGVRTNSNAAQSKDNMTSSSIGMMQGTNGSTSLLGMGNLVGSVGLINANASLLGNPASLLMNIAAAAGNSLLGNPAGGGSHDSFRSRPPNTSRPPSMHVDDFQKLQKDEKVEEEIMIRERNLRSLRGGRAGIRTINQGSRTVGGTKGFSTSNYSVPPSNRSSNK